MNSFIAQPNQQYTIGQPICRSKRRCDVVEEVTMYVGEDGFPSEIKSGLLPFDSLYRKMYQRGINVLYRPMTWWESLKHELFGHCEADNG